LKRDIFKPNHAFVTLAAIALDMYANAGIRYVHRRGAKQDEEV
jgi:hypothetical protein